MRLLWLLFGVLVSVPVWAQTKQLCITVDDLPTVTNGVQDFAFREEITAGIVEALVAYEVPAIGYVNERQLYRNGVLDSAQVGLLRQWLSAGLELGNHTYSHPNYHRVSFEEFTADLLKGERVTRALVAEYGSELRFFRHPYLRIGRDAGHADSLRDFLVEHGYTEAPVTIDNADYLFALAYTRAYVAEDTALMARIGTDYVDYMEAKLVYFEGQSVKLFGRPMAQTLLTHANYLNAHYMDDLLAMYARHGYAFVSQATVLEDAAYETPITVYGEYGISWIDRWALSRGLRGDFFGEDPRVPEYIEELTQ